MLSYLLAPRSTVLDLLEGDDDASVGPESATGWTVAWFEDPDLIEEIRTAILVDEAGEVEIALGVRRDGVTRSWSWAVDEDEKCVDDADGVTRNWDAIKRAERAAKGEQDTSALAGISRGLPEWQRAVKLQSRAARVGFDWPGPLPVLDKAAEELQELREEFERGDIAGNKARLQEELGDLLFVCANLARHADIDLGAALRGANHKFERRFRAMEAQAEAQGEALAALDLDAQEALWQHAKEAEKA